MKFQLFRGFCFLALLTVVILGMVNSATAQDLDQDCIVNILNRTVQVAPDGGWSMPNVPSTMGQVRARATCTRNGKTTSGQTDFFLVARNGVTQTGSFQFGSLEPPPSALAFDPSDSVQVNGAQTTLVLKVIATYPDSSSREVTESNSGVNYTSTNPGIASVDAEGLVTGQSSGNALIIARLDGALAVLQLSVLTSGDSDGDGLPDDYEIAKGLNPNDPVDAQEDQDSDGLSALSEFNAGTEPKISDTDGDTILDGEEIVIGNNGFITNPLLFDTDGDGIGDGLEISTASDPTDPNSFNLAQALASFSVSPSTLSLIYNTIIGESSRQLTVTGVLTDGNSIDLTSTAKETNYSSSDLTICSFGAVSGRVFAGVDGSCTLTVSNSGFSDNTTAIVQSFAPIALSSLAISGASNVDVNSNMAFVTAGTSGLHVVNISNRNAPHLMATINTEGSANDVKVVGNIAFVADGSAGLQLIDISNPSVPVLISTVDTPGSAVDVVIKGTLAFVADSVSGLQIIDIVNPLSPSLIGSFNTATNANGVDVSSNGQIAVVARQNSGIQVVNVTDPSRPSLLGEVSTGIANDVVVNGNFAFVADIASSLTVVDISDPRAPVVRASTPSVNGGLLNDLALANRFVFGADIFFVNGVPIIDISSPETPLPVAILDFRRFGDHSGHGIAVDSNYIYLVGGSHLFIGQYLNLKDLEGIPPIVSIIEPLSGGTVIETSTVPISVVASDDIAVATVEFELNGQLIFTDTSAPYTFNLVVPEGVSTLIITATAFDIGGNSSTSLEAELSVIPDPLTTVVGRVIDESNSPLENATVNCLDISSLTELDGRFSISNVPTVTGNVRCLASFVDADENTLKGFSNRVLPILAGITSVGDIELRKLDLNNISSITVSPFNPEIIPNTTTQFTAVAIFKDGSEEDITDLVSWHSSAESRVTISNEPVSTGLAQGVMNGSSRITALEPTTGALGGTTTLNRNSYYLDFRQSSINSAGTVVTVSPGASLAISLDYTIWSRIGCPGCIDYIAVGIEGDGQDTHFTGIPGTFPGRNGRASFNLTTPVETGTYTIYGLLAPDVSARNAINRYERGFPNSVDPGFIPIGTIHVE